MFVFKEIMNAEEFHNIMVKPDGVINAIKQKVPWLTQQVDIRINRREDDSDSDDEFNEDGRRMDNEMLFERTLTKTMVRRMVKANLTNELQKRGADTLGNVDLLKKRLCALVDREMEESYTRGDRDQREGVPLLGIQMDSATPHIGNGNLGDINESLFKQGINIKVHQQPQKSPELNLCDLCVNRSLESHSQLNKTGAHTFTDLLVNVVKEFEDYPIEYIERAYAMSFAVYREILKQNGGNDFPSPHEGIRAKQNNGLEIVDLNVPVSLVQSAELWLTMNPLPPVP